ncbi:hypothetical protein [Bdellovibrio sp. BCCA]|uniref:hypothetical protein n=1 Tax=Bdellovibrio sp. BCCA TaxID=3136281 RepID=UPI0030F0315B
MKTFFMIFTILLSITARAEFAEDMFGDKKMDWVPKDKVYDAFCVTNYEANQSRSFTNAILRKFSSKSGEAIIDVNDKRYKVDLRHCYLQQRQKEQVARIEFLDAIYSVECKYAVIKFNNANFRLLNLNKFFIAAKRLNDGAVFIFSRDLCSTKMQSPQLDALTRQSGAVKTYFTPEGGTEVKP